MTESCFPNNFIPLNGDCATYTTTSSNLFVNDLPGLSFRLLASLSNEEQKTASQLYQVSHAEGIRRFIRDFKAGMMDKYLYKNVLGSNRTGRMAKTFTGVVGTTNVGKELELVNCQDRFQCLFVEYVEITVNAPLSLDLSIIDGYDTTASSHTLTAGRNRIYLNYEARNSVIQVVYDATATDMPDELLCWNTGSACGCNGSCTALGSTYQGLKIKDVEDSGGGVYVDSNIENGLIIAASARCSSNELACIFQMEAAPAIRYAIGIDIMRRVEASDRINPLIRSKKEQIDEKLIEWDGGKSGRTGFIHKGQYHKEVKLIIKQAKAYLQTLTGATKCLDCSGKRVEYITP